jgi:nucleotide-binding universal stress UspA family protein
MFDNVVIGAKFDAGALDALALAKAIAPEARKLTLVHVEVTAQPEGGNGSQPAGGLRDPLLAVPDARGATEYALCAVAAPSVAEGLRDYASAAGADLLVIGARDRIGLQRALHRDSGGDVLDDAPCAVAVAPAGFAGSRQELGRIGVGYDSSLASELAVATARTIANRRQATLSAFEAVPPVVFTRDPLGSEDAVRQRVAAARDRVSALDGVEGHAEFGPSDSELASFGATVDLLVLGPHDPAGEAAHSHTLAHRVADQTPCPVLVVGRPQSA